MILSNDKEMFYFPVLVFEKEIYFLFAKKRIFMKYIK